MLRNRLTATKSERLLESHWALYELFHVQTFQHRIKKNTASQLIKFLSHIKPRGVGNLFLKIIILTNPDKTGARFYENLVKINIKS